MNAKKHPGEPNFAGTISDTYQTSTPAWPDLPQGLGGANVITIVFDDMGFSHPSCFGSSIPTPNIDRLAQNGLRYTMCSRESFGPRVRSRTQCVSMNVGIPPSQIAPQ